MSDIEAELLRQSTLAMQELRQSVDALIGAVMDLQDSVDFASGAMHDDECEECGGNGASA